MGECDYDGDWKLTLELCLSSTLTGILRNKHPYYKSSVFSVSSPHNSSCCDLSQHSETKIPFQRNSPDCQFVIKMCHIHCKSSIFVIKRCHIH